MGSLLLQSRVLQPGAASGGSESWKMGCFNRVLPPAGQNPEKWHLFDVSKASNAQLVAAQASSAQTMSTRERVTLSPPSKKTAKPQPPKRGLVCVLGGSSSELFGPKFKKFLKLGPGPQKWAPGLHGSQNGASEPSKSLNNHDSDLQNLENTIAKLLKNGTVAGYARSALDIYIYIYIYIYITITL